jgi:hypothetical protein
VGDFEGGLDDTALLFELFVVFAVLFDEGDDVVDEPFLGLAVLFVFDLQAGVVSDDLMDLVAVGAGTFEHTGVGEGVEFVGATGGDG